MIEGTDMNQIEKVARPKLVDELALAIDQFLSHQIERDTLACDLTQDELTELATGLAAIAAMPVQAEPQWQGIESAPDMDRVIVAGWEPRSGNVRGYWWYGEDVVINGRATMHPRATLWRPFNNPAFPTPPAGGSDGTES